MSKHPNAPAVASCSACRTEKHNHDQISNEAYGPLLFRSSDDALRRVVAVWRLP